MQMARDLVIPPTGGPSDRCVPFTTWEKEKAQTIYHRLVALPAGLREDIRNLASLVDMAGAYLGRSGHGVAGRAQGHGPPPPSRVHRGNRGRPGPPDLGDAAETLEPRSETAREGLLCKMHQLRAELAGPKPSGVEWHLADAAALSWADYHRCVIERERLTDEGA